VIVETDERAIAARFYPIAGREKAVGLIMLSLFLPEHNKLWNSFPIWYQLTFLLTLAPLVLLGGWLVQRRGVTAGTPVVAS
jgi:hypothetical protein